MKVVVLFFLMLFGLSSIWLIRLDISWHDHQRIAQIVVLVVTSFLYLIAPIPRLSGPALALILGIFSFGLLSSLFSATYPHWALIEWARYICLAAMALLLGSVARTETTQRAVVFLIIGISAAHAFQFGIAYVMAFVTGIRNIGTDILISGFSNRRFFGQFQIVALPLLAFGVCLARERGRRAWTLAAFVVLSVQWCIVLIAGGRGVWLAMISSHLFLVMLAREHMQLVKTQIAALLAGLCLFLVCFHWIPFFLDFPSGARSTLRSSLSGREQIWSWALEMTLSHPWLGVGPMHFSETFNKIAAHPHQLILQWSSEWGTPSALMLCAIIFWGMLFGLQRLRSADASSLPAALWLSLFGALVLAQVDGVFVMPYTETWFFVLTGLGIACWGGPNELESRYKKIMVVALIPAALLLMTVLYEELPVLFQNRNIPLADHHVGLQPRFWINGWLR